jgi:hypothetical protein
MMHPRFLPPIGARRPKHRDPGAPGRGPRRDPRRQTGRQAFVWLGILATVLAGAALQSQRSQRWQVREDLSAHEPKPRDSGSSFNFVRVRYDSEGGPMEAFYVYDGRLWERWETDHPQADENFAFRLQELTSVAVNRRSLVRRLTDPDLFDFPFLYFCDVGWIDLQSDETAALREYLLRGGFLWVDDFWGAAEWRAFERTMEEVLPEIPWVELPADHPILSTLFPLDGVPQIPARDFAQYMPHDPPEIHRQPAYGIQQVRLRAYLADDGRILALATLNTDIGDGWEREAYGEWFFEKFSSRAYAVGANIVLWALTH